MSAKLNHNHRSSRITHKNKTYFNSMVRRKKLRDYYFGVPLKGIVGARVQDERLLEEKAPEETEEN